VCVRLQSGQYAWVCLLIVSALLYGFRFIYGEVVSAMPVNGGVYNAMLNTTRKQTAALAGCLSFLSYLATYVCQSSVFKSLHVRVTVGTLVEGLSRVVKPEGLAPSGCTGPLQPLSLCLLVTTATPECECQWHTGRLSDATADS
jgi:amino acid transporter